MLAARGRQGRSHGGARPPPWGRLVAWGLLRRLRPLRLLGLLLLPPLFLAANRGRAAGGRGRTGDAEQRITQTVRLLLAAAAGLGGGAKQRLQSLEPRRRDHERTDRRRAVAGRVDRQPGTV